MGQPSTTFSKSSGTNWGTFAPGRWSRARLSGWLLSRPLLTSGATLVLAIGLGLAALVYGNLASAAGRPLLGLPLTVLGSFALALAVLSELILFREAFRERTVLDAEELLRESPVAQVLLDPGGRIVSINAGEELRLRRPAHDFVGHPFASLFPPTQAERVVRALRTSHLDSFEVELPALRDLERPVSLNVIVGRQRQGTSTRVAAVLNVSDRARLVAALAEQGAELARSNRELESFAYIASHDLQEPLRMVGSYTQLLQERYGERLDQDGREFLLFATEGAQRMQRLIEDLLTYSRVGRKSQAPSRLDMDRILERCLKDLRTRILETSAIVEVSPLPATEGDESEVAQLLENLVGNALKFHGNTPPVIRIFALEQADEVRYIVEDRGIGIPPTDQARIFDPFFRLHSREEYPGTGIGLAICKKVVERHGGRLWVESLGVPGEPTRFVFTLERSTSSAERVRRSRSASLTTAEHSRAWALIEERLKGLA